MAQDAAWVPVLPQMKDFASSLVKEVSSASKMAGTQGGNALSNAMSAATKTDAADKMVSDLKKASQQATRTVQQETNNIGKARASQKDAAAAVTMAEQKLADARTKYGSGSAQAVAAEQKLEAARERQQVAANKVETAEDSLKAAKTQQKTVNGQLSDAERKLADATGKTGDEVSGQGSIWDRFKSRISGTAAEAERSQSTFSRLKGGISSVAGALGLVGGVTAAIGFFKNYVGGAVEASDATDKFKNTLSFANIKTDKIDALTKSTQKYADATVYDLSDIQSMTAQLASNGVDNYDKLAEAAGNLNAVAGGNADTFKSVGMVMTQTAGQGKLTTENWNQLSDAIPGASGKIQDALLKAGAYTGNFRDAMAKGEITAAEFNKAVMGLGMTDVAKKAATSTSTMEGAWGNFSATVTGGISGMVTTLKPTLTGGLSWASDKLGGFFSWTGGALEGLVALVGKGDFTDAFRKAFHVEEDSPAVTLILKIRDGVIGLTDLLVKGDFSGALRRAFNVEEDSPLVTMVLRARDAVIDFAKSIPDRIGAAFSWVQANKDWLGPIAAGIGAVVVAFKLYNGAIAVWQTATKIATAVQGAFNLVLNANPIGLIILAIVGLVAGLTYFFTKTETGRKLLADIQTKIRAFVAWIGPAWSNLWNGAGKLWSDFWRGIVNGWNTMWSSVKSSFSSAKTFVTNTWNGLWNGLGKKWSDFWHDVRTGATTLKDNVVNAFKNMGDGVGKAWGKIKEAAAKPVNFVIETVYTGGLKKLADTVFSKLGMSTRLPSISPIKYAGGGYVPGYAPGRDTELAVLSKGEAVLVPELVRAIGPSRILAANAAASGRPAGGAGLGHYAGGGISGALSSIGGFFKDKWEGLGSFLGNIADGVKNLISAPVKALLGQIGGGIVGDLGKGVINTALGGLTSFFKKQTSDLAAPAGGLVGSAMAAVRAGVPYVWGGSSVPPGLDCSGLVYWAAQRLGLNWPRLTAAGYQAASRGISRANAGPGSLLFWGSPAYHVAINAGDGMMVEEPKPGLSARYTRIWGNPSAGVYGGGNSSRTYNQLVSSVLSSAGSSATVGQVRNRLYAAQYDQGGVLLPGITNVVNASNKPEAILTNSQWKNLERIADTGNTAGNGGVTLMVYDVDNKLIGTMDARIDRKTASASRQSARAVMGV